MKRVFLTVGVLFCLLLAASAQQPVAALRPPSAAASPATQAPPAEKIWADLMEGNQRFVAGAPSTHNLVSLRSTLAKGQHPNVIVLGCSDSRVSPELVFDHTLGDLFVVRSAGNIADSVGLGSMEYAVEHLGSSVIVVLGHQKCGAVTAACSQEKMPTPNLQAIVDQINPAVLQVGASAQGDARTEAAIKQNVHQSAKDLLAHSDVLHHAVEEGKLTVIEAEYELETGRVDRLDATAGH